MLLWFPESVVISVEDDYKQIVALVIDLDIRISERWFCPKNEQLFAPTLVRTTGTMFPESSSDEIVSALSIM